MDMEERTLRATAALGSAVFLILSLTGCAGPTTPFGAINGFGSFAKVVSSKLFGGVASGTHIRFTPRRQVLHDRMTFDIIIDDPEGIPDSYSLLFIYNGRDMTSSFLRGASVAYTDPKLKQLRLTTKDVRLLPTKEHKIRVIYMHGPDTEPVVADFHPPTCQAFEAERSIASVHEFDAPQEYVQMINKYSRKERFNPYYIAGLIAQESGFDAGAVSPNKALGLTQITTLGEGEVLKENPKWPRYPGIERMSVMQMKLKILNGEMNSKNEWRLNPDLSIHGGVEYMAYLNEYWGRPEKRVQIQGAELSEVLLASYNSGAARVSRAIERKGPEWLQDDELSEARTYVRRVTSYCDSFSSGKGR
jgi:hypothetical protein